MAASPETRSQEQLHTLEGDIVARDIALSYCEHLHPDYVNLKHRAERTSFGDAQLVARYDMVRLNMDMLLEDLFALNVMIEAYDGTPATT